MPTLETRQIQTFYGESRILNNISVRVEEGSLTALLGRNGVGKTTFLRTVMGLTPVRSGEVLFNGKRITNSPTYEISKLGIGYMPQVNTVFPYLSVKDNLRVSILINPKKSNILELTKHFPILEERSRQKAGSLSGGEQKMLSLAMVLSRNPSFVLLDEPTEGLQPSMIAEFNRIIVEMREKLPSLSIILVDQHIKEAFDIADRCYIMEKGQVVAEGTAKELNNEEIIKRHLLV